MIYPQRCGIIEETGSYVAERGTAMFDFNGHTFGTDDTNESKALQSMIVNVLLIGLVLIFMINNLSDYITAKSILKDNFTVTATVSDLNFKGKGMVNNPIVYVDYQVDGVDYHNIRLGQLGRRPKRGAEITVCYNRKNPSKIATAESAARDLNGAGTSFVMCFLLLGLICFVNKMNPESLMKKL